jgi:ribosomal protein L37AE/L43A
MAGDDDSGGFDLTSAIESGADAVRETFRTIAGTQREKHVCPSCNVACEPTYTYDPDRAAFDGGESPAWECPECSREFVRETGEESYSMDLYGRDPPQ